jgi:hypothetical protein
MTGCKVLISQKYRVLNDKSFCRTLCGKSGRGYYA